MGMNKLQANLCLICVSLIWSTEVIIFACIPDSVLPFATTCITNLIGGVLLFLCFFRRIIADFKKNKLKLVRRGVLLSVLNCAYNILFLYGLNYFDVSTGAFSVLITVVIVPIIMTIKGNTVGKRTWLSAGIILTGILIALSDNLFALSIPGLLLILGGCVFRAIFIIRLNLYAREHDPLSIAFSYNLPASFISFILWACFQPATFAAIPWDKTIVASLVIHSYFVIALAGALNIFAQRRATPASVTIIYACSIIFTVFWGIILPGTLINPIKPDVFTVIGIVFIILGNCAELADFSKLKRRKEAPHETA